MLNPHYNSSDLFNEPSTILITFSGVPMQESLPSEHGCELFRNSFEDFLNGCRVSDESGAHRQVSGRNVANGSLHVVRDPLNKEPVKKIQQCYDQELKNNLVTLRTVTIRLPDNDLVNGTMTTWIRITMAGWSAEYFITSIKWLRLFLNNVCYIHVMCAMSK